MFAIFLTACSTTSKKGAPPTVKSFKEATSKLCFSGEGKGHLKFFQKRYNFSFESFLQPKKNLYSFGIHIPLHGEEIIHINWRDAYSGKVKVLGEFYQRLKNQARKHKGGRQQIKLLRWYLSKYAVFIKYITEDGKDFTCSERKVEGEDWSGTCRHNFAKHTFSWYILDDDHLLLKFPTTKNYFLQVDVTGLRSKYYSHQKISLRGRASDQKESESLTLKLYFKTCQKN